MPNEADAQRLLMSEAVKQYPALRSLNVQSITTPLPNDNRMLEFWPPQEPGDAQFPRPQELPVDQPGVQIISPETRPSDVAADIVSHYMVNTDPNMIGMYKQFADTFQNPAMQSRLQQDYEWSKANEGEKRPFDQWLSITRIPDYLRGYMFKQWPEKAYSQMYSPEQIGLLDKMNGYLQNGSSVNRIADALKGMKR